MTPVAFARWRDDAGLVTLAPGGRIERAGHRPAKTEPVWLLDADEPPGTFSNFDASMAETDRLLARATSPR